MAVTNYFDDHDPKAKLDYTIKWSTWLNGDQITGSSWQAAPENPDANMSVVTVTFTTGSTTIWLASGSASLTYRFENQIGTVGGRENNDSIIVAVRDA